MISSMTTLAPGGRVRNSVNSGIMNLRTQLVDRTLHGLASAVDGAGAAYVFVGRLHRGVNIVFNGPRAAANNGTLGFCTSIHLSVHGTATVGSKRSIMNGLIHIGMIGGGITPPFHGTRFSVVFNRNVDHTNRMFNLTMTGNVVSGDND